MVLRLAAFLLIALTSNAAAQVKVHDITEASSGQVVGELIVIPLGGGEYAWEVPGKDGQGRLTASGKITFDGKTYGTWSWTGGWTPQMYCSFTPNPIYDGLPLNYYLVPQQFVPAPLWEDESQSPFERIVDESGGMSRDDDHSRWESRARGRVTV